jgi:hypothetical protein
MNEGMMLEIKQRALLLYTDNPRHYANLDAVEAAMTIGASIVIERGGPDPIPDEIPNEVFQRPSVRHCIKATVDELLSSERELVDEDRWRHEEHIKDIRRMAGSTPRA